MNTHSYQLEVLDRNTWSMAIWMNVLQCMSYVFGWIDEITDIEQNHVRVNDYRVSWKMTSKLLSL